MPQAQAQVPRLETPLVNPDGSVSIPWYRFLVQLYKLCGGSVALADAAYVVISGANTIDVYDSLTNAYVATIATTGAPGQPVVPLAPGASPFTFVAGASGTIVVFGGQVELARGASGWKKASLNGGSFQLKLNDQARVTWFGADAPEVSWWPD